MRKHLLFTMLCSILLGTTNTFARIWRVNNNTGVNADFTTLQAAHDGAANGDIIHLEASATSYGNLNCTKQLTILGPGYFLDENPNTQASKVSVKSESIQFYNGSSGSVLMGIMVGIVQIYSSNISIRRNYFYPYTNYSITIAFNNQTGSAVSNIIITQNYFDNYYDCIYNNSQASNILVTNNFINTQNPQAGYNSILLHPNTTSSVIQNNILRGKLQVYNSAVFNNILREGGYVGDNNNLSNNLGNATQFSTTNSNKQNVDMTAVFVGKADNISTDGQWNLKAGSPAKGAGFGGIDAGIFGGSTSYVLSGIPPVPSIYSLDVQPIGSGSDPIDVVIKVKSNN